MNYFPLFSRIFSSISLIFALCSVWNADIRNFISCWMFAPKLVTILLLNCCKSTLFCRVSCAVCSVEPSRASFPGHIEANLGGGGEEGEIFTGEGIKISPAAMTLSCQLIKIDFFILYLYISLPQCIHYSKSVESPHIWPNIA